MVDVLPSLGASTAVPGAAGLSTTVNGTAQPWTPGSPDGYYSDGLHITVTGGKDDKAAGFTNVFGDTFKRLWGMDPAEAFPNPKTENTPATDPNGAAGEEVIPGPIAIPGNLDDLIKWLQENAPLLIVIALVLLLAFYGLSAATRR